MSQPYVGQLICAGFNFAPVGWSTCQGQLMAISENETLFQLIGTTYGGDGQSTFALPNLSGRTPLHAGTGRSGTTYQIGELAGTENVTLTSNQIPVHNHTIRCSTNTQNSANAQGSVLAVVGSGVNMYSSVAPVTPMAANSLQTQGGSQPHNNLQPYLVLNWCISLFGIFPSQN